MADPATIVQYGSLELVAVTVAAVAGVQQETPEMVWVLVQKATLVQHSVIEHLLVVM